MMYEKKRKKQITEEETSGAVVIKHLKRNQLAVTNNLCGLEEPSRNSVVVPVRQPYICWRN
jgi:hypothetical protein